MYCSDTVENNFLEGMVYNDNMACREQSADRERTIWHSENNMLTENSMAFREQPICTENRMEFREQHADREQYGIHRTAYLYREQNGK